MTNDYICYCFKYTRQDLEEDARTHGKSIIMEEIMEHSKAKECNCKTNNPKGR